MGIEATLRLNTAIGGYLQSKYGRRRDLGVDELRVLDRYAENILDGIQSRWPVDTSTSRDAFTYTVRGDRTEIAIVIENDADYAEYVHLKGTPAEPALYETLIPEVWESWRGALVSELRAEIDRTEALIASEKQRPGGLTERRILAGQRPSGRVLRPGRAA